MTISEYYIKFVSPFKLNPPQEKFGQLYFYGTDVPLYNKTTMNLEPGCAVVYMDDFGEIARIVATGLNWVEANKKVRPGQSIIWDIKVYPYEEK